MAVLGLAMLAAPAQAQQMPAPTPAPLAGNGPVYVVTFIETGAAVAARAATVLRRMAASGRKEPGNGEFVVLREIGRPGRFATLEGWRDKSALDAHDAAAKTSSEQLTPLLVAPPDRRPSVALDIAPARPATAAGGLYVLTHVDVIPPKKDEAIALLKELAPSSRKERGAERFDVWQQASRPNHSFMIEVWHDPGVRDAHITAAPVREFRAKLLPLQGSLYDERIYQPIR
jgi:quinol monooxygenase YgiN